MNSVIPVTSSADFSDLRLEKTVNGHVCSPWFSFDYSAELKRGLYNWNSQYHSLVAAAKSAFSSHLGIGMSDIIVSERRDAAHDEIWWRLGTKNPCELPKPKKLSQVERMLSIQKLVQDVESPKALKHAGPPAIDI